MMLVVKVVAVVVVAVMLSYMARHYLFAFARLFRRQRMNYTDLSGFHLPSISVLIPMHNEEAVAPDVIEALLEADYPHDPQLFEIIPINDHSTDRTGEILDAYARKYPFIKPLHRTAGVRGKPAGLRDATRIARGDVLIVFDADYIPGKSLLKFLAAPFADPEIGAVMGRVVPHNVGASLLTRLLDLERAGGYQINQQARYNLGLIPQFGGTVGSVRRTALESVGGWNQFSLTEDTDLTLRLAIQGWKIAYVNRAECYEEVPESWRARRGQIERWAVGHTDCFHRYLGGLLRSRFLDWKTKLDGALMLGVYLTAPLLVVGWIACTVLFFGGDSFLPALAAFFIASTAYNVLGNFSSFFEIGSSVILDGAHRRVRLLPLNIANFVFSTAAVSGALLRYYTNRLRGRDPGSRWVKTQRFRNGGNGGNHAAGPRPDGQSGASNPAGNHSPAESNGSASRSLPQGSFLSLFSAGTADARGNGRGLNYLRGAGHGNGYVPGTVQHDLPSALALAAGNARQTVAARRHGTLAVRSKLATNRDGLTFLPFPANGRAQHEPPAVAENGNAAAKPCSSNNGKTINYLRTTDTGRSSNRNANANGDRDNRPCAAAPVQDEPRACGGPEIGDERRGVGLRRN